MATMEATAMDADVGDAGGHCAALAKKLQHPLVKVRARALRSLLFKLRERLVRVSQLAAVRIALVPHLLAALSSPELELDALHVLDIVVASGSRELLAELQANAAANALQRAALGKQPELQAVYEKLLQKIYATPQPRDRQNPQAAPELAPPARSVEVAAQSRKESTSSSQTRTARQWSRRVPELEARGWRFAPVPLAFADEQFLFEFEVRLDLRTATEDVVGICNTIRSSLLRDFPAEVFLQRPAVLQYLLHLIRQPLLPPTTTDKPNGERPNVMDRVMAVSLGVNYFDAIGSATFSPKRGNITGAVLMAGIAALESFLAAIRGTFAHAVDPMRIVSDPKMSAEYHYVDAYDHRRHLYPRSVVDRQMLQQIERGGVNGTEPAGVFSLAGAIYRIFMSLLPLVRNATHPRLHILNLLHFALEDLLERQNDDVGPDEVNELDKQRVELIFEVLGNVCRPLTGPSTIGACQNPIGLLSSAELKLVELATRLLKLYPPATYRVEMAAPGTGSDETERKRIQVPPILWKALKTWITSPAALQMPSLDWDRSHAVEFFGQLDDTLPSYVELNNSVQEDVREMQAFVAVAEHNRTSHFVHWTPLAGCSLQVALNVIQATDVWDKEKDVPIIADGVAFACWRALGHPEGATLAVEDARLMQEIVLHLSGAMLSPVNTRLFAKGELATKALQRLGAVLNYESDPDSLSADSRDEFVRSVMCCQRVLESVLWSIALLEDERGEQHEERIAALWGLVTAFVHGSESFTGEELARLRMLIPVLQLLAYREYGNVSEAAQTHQATRSQLVGLLNRVETQVSLCERLLLISRCLLHNSVYLRSSAASGIRQILSRDFQDSRGSGTTLSSLKDPFARSLDDDDEPDATWETKLVEYPLPSNDMGSKSYETVGGHDLSSQLRKLANLCNIVRTANDLVQESALKEVNLIIESSSAVVLTLLDEVAETSKLAELCREILSGKLVQGDADGMAKVSLVPLALRLLRNLLFRSESLRKSVRSSADFLRDVLSHLFDARLAVRMQMYYVVLLLTCSADYFVPGAFGGEGNSISRDTSVQIPALVEHTFGLHCTRWQRCSMPVLSSSRIAEAVTSFADQVNAIWLQAVQASISTPLKPNSGDIAGDEDGRARSIGTDMDSSFPASIMAEYAALTHRLRGAPSHGKFLNALYHLITLCRASVTASCRLADEWETVFKRYVTVEPKSERDEVIIGAVIHTIAVVLPEMSRAAQLRVLFVVKRAFLPLLRRSVCTLFGLESARLLLHMSRGQVRDVFPSLVADTDLFATICTNYSSEYSTKPALHAVMLELIQSFVVSLRGIHFEPTAPFHNVIRQRMVAMISPLVTIVCRHRLPGSYLGHDVFCSAVSCLVHIYAVIPRNELLAGDSSFQHTDVPIIVDGSWSSRLIFHHESSMRALGFSVLRQFANAEVTMRMLELAVETALDRSECDIVRGEAFSVIGQVLLQYPTFSNEEQVQISSMASSGHSFTSTTPRQLVDALMSDNVCLQASIGLVKIIRVLLAQRDALPTAFGAIATALKNVETESEFYPAVVQALSIRYWSSKCDEDCSRRMQMDICDPQVWRRSLLPRVFDYIVEGNRLLHATMEVLGERHVRYLNEHTTLKYQLMELIQDTEASLAALTLPGSRKEGSNDAMLETHFTTLTQAAETLAMVLAKPSKEASEPQDAATAPAFIENCPRELLVGLLKSLASLMEPHYPRAFRVDFVRVIAPVVAVIPNLTAADADAIKMLCSAVFDLFQDLADVDSSRGSSTPLDDTTLVTDMERTSVALQTLLEASQAARRVMEAKRGLEFCMNAIKDLFHSIRTAGGFGAASSKNGDSKALLNTCDEVSVHMNVLSSLIGDDEETQTLAKTLHLPSTLSANWNVMKVAHTRGSRVFLSALRLLGSYIYRNDATKASLSISQQLPGSRVSSENLSIMALLCELVLPQRLPFVGQSSGLETRNSELRVAACDVLSATVLSPECQSWMNKYGIVSKLIKMVQEHLQTAAQTKKSMDQAHAEHIGRLLRVLAALVWSEDGCVSVYASSTDALAYILRDILETPEQVVQSFGFLFLRNLALVDVSKSYSALWEDLLPHIVAACGRQQQNPSTNSLELLGTTLWSLTHDNQKIKALITTMPTVSRDLEGVIAVQSSLRGPNGATSLERVVKIIKG